MKLVKKVRLAFREGNSDKVYEVDLVELPGGDAARYLVNFRFGRRGRELREGTKTAAPVPLAEAEALYQSVVISKTNKGYWDEADPNAKPSSKPGNKTTRSAAPADHAAQQAARHAVLINALNAERDSRRRARLIWNLGNSPFDSSTLHAVTANIMRGDWREDYAIAWTLGRWRDAAALSALEQLQRHTNPHVKDIAYESLLAVAPPTRALNLAQADAAELPAALAAALQKQNEIEIAQALQQLATEHSPHLSRALMVCYRLGLSQSAALRAVRTMLTNCAIAPGAFKAIRHIFKTAEMRLDYDTFALLAYRFDTVPAFFRNQWERIYLPGQGMMVASTELAKPQPRLAYSDKTRHYLRRRACRTLQRLGRADSSHYVALAKAVLLQVSDSDATKPRLSEVYRWVGEDRPRRQLVSKKQYDEFAHFLAFNQTLHGAHRRFRLNRRGTAWFRTGEPESQRGERFAHLWDQAPDAALDLLKRSRCALVHDAGIRMLATQTDFLAALSSGEVAALLQSPYLQTVQFALPLARALFERGAGDDALLLSLLKSTLSEAVELGLQTLQARPNLAHDAALLVELMLIFTPALRPIIDQALSTGLSDVEQQQLANTVITQLLSRSLRPDAEFAEALARMITERLPMAAVSLPLTLLDRLLSQSELGLQLLGARLLTANAIAFGDIPGRMLEHIHGSAHEAVRALAAALLNKQSIDELLPQAPMLAELYYRGTAAERRELLVLLARLADSGAEPQARVLQAMLGLLFRAEHEPGQADELFQFFDAHLASAAATLDKDTVWRLLQAQSTTAQRVGVALLLRQAPTQFTVRQWARLAQHADASARQFAMDAFTAHGDRIKQHTRDALLILDSTWDDARQFGFKYFRERYADADWSPEFIVGVCDSTDSEVQAFGRELLQRFFQQAQGPAYLGMLSQHPSLNVQLFVSNFLEAHAAGHSERILLLRGFFVTVLSHINKGRTCKDRVLAFLLRESLRDSAVATMAADIFTRLSLTVVRKDRGQLIKAMIALQTAFPQLSLPLKSVAPRTLEATHGV